MSTTVFAVPVAFSMSSAQTLSFDVPDGIYSAANWSRVGVISGFVDPYYEEVYCSDSVEFPIITAVGAVYGTVAASAAQLAAINAAAGSSLMATFRIHSPTTGGGTDAVSTFSLILTPVSIFCESGQTGAGTVSEPFTLPGTQIQPLNDNMRAWAARVERQNQWAETVCELWFWRDSVWQPMPSPLWMDERKHPVLTRKYRQPASLYFGINNDDGLLTRTNQESPYNYDLENNFDPVIDAHRKICFRVGTRCWQNLACGITPSVSASPSTGTLATLTEGLFADYTQTTPACCLWTATGTTPVTLIFDLGTPCLIRNVAASFGTAARAASGFTLPASVQVQLSLDDSTWSAYPVRPLGGPGAAGVPPGDWADDPYGSAVTVAFSGLGAWARYVKLVVTPTGAQTWAMDQVGIWGGPMSQVLGCNKFVGYLGDLIAITSEGAIQCLATDTLKRLADNNEARLTSRFGLVDVADIAYSILTAATIWRGATGAYDAPLTSAEIGWQTGVALTGFIMPVWQGQGNSVLGYEYELWHEVGWHLWADGNGVLQATEPPYRQYRPDRVMIAAPDGSNDARFFARDISDADIRNVVEITTGTVKGGGAGSLTLIEPASVARYGHLRTIITDELATMPDLRVKLAAATLREYAWRLDQLLCEIAPDFDTAIKGIHAFRTGQQPNVTLGRVMLRAAGCTVPGRRCEQELWSLEAIEEHFTAGKWWGNCWYRPYVPAAIAPPSVVSLTPGTGGTATQMVLLWNLADDFTISPVSGNGAVSTQSGLFTVAILGYTTATLTIALSDGGNGGTFKNGSGSPISSLTFAATGTAYGPAPQTFTYTPSSGYSGGRILTLTASGAFSKVHTVDYSVGTSLYFPPPTLDEGQFALAGYNVYLSAVSEDDPNAVLQNSSLIAAYNGSAEPVTQYTVTGLTVGDQYWVYMTAVDTNGHESEPSTILSAFAGSGPASSSSWTVTDLSAAFDSVSGPDPQGYYTYQFDLLWTSPPIPAPSPDRGLYGFKRMSINYTVGALPADPNANPGGWSHNQTDEWAGARVPPGLMWDRATPGQLSWQSRWRVSSRIASGTTIYFRMITSATTLGWHGAFQSNIASCTIP